ncbi:DUF7695 domain-containing protein [Pseudogracilibacillus sp. SO30301A]|uniref:DUF7695 domain-containing protein n=1 Tax=Pseudogracilibacillus sp. SO30301A TaxID=3098291 RepID=UPI00300E250C
MSVKVLVNSVQCKKCNDIIESKHTHDLQYCKCKSIYIDGGTDYQRYGGNIELIDFSYSVYEEILQICGVEFTDKAQYENVKRAVESLKIEGIQPTYDRVKGIKDLLDGKITHEELAVRYKKGT